MFVTFLVQNILFLKKKIKIPVLIQIRPGIKKTFKKIISEMLIKIRTNVHLVLIRVQTVCKCYQQLTLLGKQI